jgi:cytochrome d ubiquinol oxidase subunit I
MDLLLFSRIQFAVTTMFHILFPVLTIGLSLYLVIVEILWLVFKKEIDYRLFRFWMKILAINFGIGVVSGIVLEFEFGTNFARFSQAVANVFSPLLAFEIMTAFFLEAGFLGIMLFGWQKVPRGVHLLATLLVSFGTVLSAFWILAANSWMQTPAGYQLVNGKFLVTDFAAAIFNPSALTRFGHMTLAAFETSAFVVAGISASYLLKGRDVLFFRRSAGIALATAALFAPFQILLGDVSGRQVFHHQPAKFASMEAHWETNRTEGAPFVAFALPDMEKERNLFEVSIPSGLSLLVTSSLRGQVPGLKEIARENRPNVFILFWSFRLMVAIGFILFLMMAWAFFLWLRGRLFEDRLFLWALFVLHPLGFIATELGWITTEVGRQPWVVYNLMRTSEGLSRVPVANVLWSLSLFSIIFGVVLASYFYYILKALRGGPDLSSPIPPIQRPAGMRPLVRMEGRG